MSMDSTLAGPQLKVGDKAPDFACLKGLEIVNLAQTPAKARLFSVVPSLNTPVCSEQTKKFDDALGALKDKVACYTFSLDLPFAQMAFCSDKSITNMATLSDVHNHSFGQNYGVQIVEGPLAGMFSRAVVVLDENNTVVHNEQIADIGDEPDYVAACRALGITVDPKAFDNRSTRKVSRND